MSWHVLPIPALAVVPLTALAQEALSPSLDAIFARYTALPDKLVPILNSVQDNASASAAAQTLKECLPELYESCKEIKAIPQLSPDEQRQIRQKYEQGMRQQWGKVYQEIFRIRRQQGYHSESFLEVFQMMTILLYA